MEERWWEQSATVRRGESDRLCHRLDALVELAGVPSFQVARESATEVAQCYLQMFKLEGKREKKGKTNVTRIDNVFLFFFFP